MIFHALLLYLRDTVVVEIFNLILILYGSGLPTLLKILKLFTIQDFVGMFPLQNQVLWKTILKYKGPPRFKYQQNHSLSPNTGICYIDQKNWLLTKPPAWCPSCKACGHLKGATVVQLERVQGTIKFGRFHWQKWGQATGR